MSKEIATPTVQIDNDHLRVTEWRFAPEPRRDITGMSMTTWSYPRVTAN